MTRNLLSDIVRSLELSGAIFLNAEFSAPWAITAHITEDDCRPFMPVPKHLIAFHVVVEGEIILSMDKTAGYRQHFRAKPGDVIFIPGNETHILASSTGQIPACGDDLLLPKDEDGLVQIRYGGGGACAKILCGFLGSNAVHVSTLEMLPRPLVINIECLTTRRWIEASVLMAVHEFSLGRLTNRGTTVELCKLMLVEALDAYTKQASAPVGVYKGITHPRIGRALSKIQMSLDCPPSVKDLAAEVGMSRSSFVERFKEVMGTGPRRYILNQRMEKARRLLDEGQMTVAEIAIRVGYDAPEAFSRAFKRELGIAPAKWRENALSSKGLTSFPLDASQQTNQIS